MTTEQAKGELMRAMEHDARMEAAGMIRRIEEEATEKAKEKARRVISMASSASPPSTSSRARSRSSTCRPTR